MKTVLSLGSDEFKDGCLTEKDVMMAIVALDSYYANLVTPNLKKAREIPDYGPHDERRKTSIEFWTERGDAAERTRRRLLRFGSTADEIMYQESVVNHE